MPVVNDLDVAKNMLGAAQDLAVQISHARTVRARAKTVYYKSAFLLLSSVVESMLYLYIKIQCSKDSNHIKNWQYPELKKITKLKDKARLGTSKDLWIVEEVKKDFELEKADFNSMIEFCDKAKLLSPYMCDQLHKIRKKRNHVHLHVANSNSYDFRLIKRTSNVLNALHKRILNI